jgi:hypothetical protein
LRVDQPEPAGTCAFAKQPLAGAEHQRKLPDPERIDEIVLQQGLQQIAAAVNLNLPARLCLELRDRFGDIALEQARAAPVDPLEGSAKPRTSGGN